MYICLSIYIYICIYRYPKWHLPLCEEGGMSIADCGLECVHITPADVASLSTDPNQVPAPCAWCVCVCARARACVRVFSCVCVRHNARVFFADSPLQPGADTSVTRHLCTTHP